MKCWLLPCTILATEVERTSSHQAAMCPSVAGNKTETLVMYVIILNCELDTRRHWLSSCFT